MHQSKGCRGSVNPAAEELVADARDLHLVLSHRRDLLPVGAIPLRAFGGLEPVLVADLEELAALREGFEFRFHVAPKRRRVRRDVVHQQVGQSGRRGSHPLIDGLFPGQLPDQKRQSAKVAAQTALLCCVVKPSDAGVELAKQDARADQVGRQGIEQVRCRDGRPQFPRREGVQRVVENPQLRTELAVSAASIHGAEARLPEPATGRQQRVVVDSVGGVLRAGADARVLQVPGHLAGVILEQLLDLGNGARLLGEQNLAGHGFDIGVDQFHPNDEPVAELGQMRRIGRERRLAGANQHQAAVETGLDRFREFGDRRRSILVGADVLLHLVEHEHRMRQVVTVRERAPGGIDELFRRDVLSGRRELRLQRLQDGLLVAGGTGNGVGDRSPEHGTHIEVVEFPPPVLALRLNGRPHRVEQALATQPEAEPRLRVLFGPAARPQEDRENGPAHPVVAAKKGARRRDWRAAGSPGLGVELAQRRLNVSGQGVCNQAAGGGAVGERGVLPQMRRHLQQMRLAAAEVPADPGRVLARSADVAEIPVEDSLQGVAEPAVADEGRQLFAKHFPIPVVGDADAGLSIVREAGAARVAIEQFVDLHGRSTSSSCSVMAWAR